MPDIFWAMLGVEVAQSAETEGRSGVLMIALAAVVLGATLQRASGTGVGLVVAPVLALLYGPAHGVLLTNVTTTVSGFLLTLTARRQVDWSAYRSIAVWSLPGACVGAILVKELTENILQIAVGTIVLVSLLTSMVIPQLPHLQGAWTRRAAGLIGGTFNTTAGVAAPAMVAYANVSRCGQASFAATMQPTFMTMGFVSVVLKSFVLPVDGGGLPPWWVLPSLGAAVALGSALGVALAHRISGEAARHVAVCLALAGGLLVLARGLGWA